MQINTLIEMGLRYSILGMICALLISTLMVIWYVTHRNNSKYTKEYCAKRIFLQIIFVCYMTVVIGVTLLDRMSMYEGMAVFQVFGSYKEA